MKRLKLTMEIELTQFEDNNTFHYKILFPDLGRAASSFQPVDQITLKQLIGSAALKELDLL